MATSVNLGVILEINGEDVPIEPKVFADAKKEGVEYSLPRRVEVGTAEELGAFLATLTDDTLLPLPSGNSFPAPLDRVYARLTSLNLAVEELKLKVPPSVAADGITPLPSSPTTFTLGLSATWSDNNKVELITGKLAIKGLYVKVAKT